MKRDRVIFYICHNFRNVRTILRQGVTVGYYVASSDGKSIRIDSPDRIDSKLIRLANRTGNFSTRLL